MKEDKMKRNSTSALHLVKQERESQEEKKSPFRYCRL